MTNREAAAAPCGRLSAFARQQDGSAVVLTLFILIAMMMVMGLAVDHMRAEQARVRIQNAVDRAVLAAANLNQEIPAEDVVRDYLAKAGIQGTIDSISVEEGIGSRTVSAQVTAEVPTLFLDMLGTETLRVGGRGTASEAITDIEITLVLDLSASMNSGGRLANMKAAATEFVEAVLAHPAADQRVSVSIVPYSGQVNAGPLLSQFNVTGVHEFGNCVNFPGESFGSMGYGLAAPLPRADLFDPFYRTRDIRVTYCPTDPASRIVAYSNDVAALRQAIAGFVADGNTSIDIGMRWANVLQDPSFRPAVDSLIAAGQVDPVFDGRPYAHDREDSAKFVVVMSDGANTTEFRIRDAYRSGLSPIWMNPSNGRLTVYRDRSFTSADWFRRSDNGWFSSPDGGNFARQLTWPEVFANMPVYYVTGQLMSPAFGGSNWYGAMMTSVDEPTKNARTAAACDAAKAQGAIVYAIGFEAPAIGQATLANCASSSAHFFDVDGIEISDAFRAIARQINQLRLTQ